MKSKDQILTSVKVHPEMFEEFKVECVKRKFSINKLTNRAMDLYLKDETFRKLIHNHQLED
jgi:hypothetical protein